MSVLITGGTGTVGYELVKQLSIINQSVIVFSRNEVKQIEMSRKFPNVKYIIGDIRDYKALKAVCKGVDEIYHLAALKHVPVCEQQPLEAIKSNVFGTMNVVKVAKKCDCHVTFMSTDKAENPSCIYGHTKAIAEKIILKAGYRVYRSGNIFGSSGSVIPLFISQVKEKNTLTLTDGNMTRFFISVRNVALDLILSEKRFPIKSFTMQSIAEMVKELYGNEETTIKYIGAREGEKLHEVLDGISSKDCLGSNDDLRKLFNDWINNV